MSDPFPLSPGKPRPRDENDERCLSCYYCGNIGGRVACLYLRETGQRRGCDPGIRCRRYMPAVLRRNLREQSGSRTMYPLDREAMDRLLEQVTYGDMARDLGLAEQTIRHTVKRGTVSRAMAELIAVRYSVNLIKDP